MLGRLSARLLTLALATGAAFFALLAPNTARAEIPATAASSSEWGSARTLGGHTFPFTMFVPTSFTTTYFGLRAGGYLCAVPNYPSLRGAVTLKDVGFGEGLDGGVRLHERLAIQGDAYGRARLGTNIDSLLGSGGQFEYGESVSVLAKVLRIATTRTQVATRIGVAAYGGQQVGVGSYASGLLRTVRGTINEVKRKLGKSELPAKSEVSAQLDRALVTVSNLFSQAGNELLTPYSAWRAQFGVTAAQAFGRCFGLQASLGFGIQRTRANPLLFRGTQPSVNVEITDTELIPSLGLVGDVDGAPLGIPVDLVVEYSPSFPRTRSVSTIAGVATDQSAWRTQQVVAGGLYYSGRADLQLGFLAHAVFGQEPLGAPATAKVDAQYPDDVVATTMKSGKPQEFGGQFVFRYIW